MEDKSFNRPHNQWANKFGDHSLKMETREAVARWVDAWTKAMRTRDPELVAAVYAEDAVARTHPFRAPTSGRNGVREYAKSTFADEETLEVRFGEPVMEGSRATVEYWAVMKTKGELVTLSGVTVLRFRADGHRIEHRDYWATQPGRVSPPVEWDHNSRIGSVRPEAEWSFRGV